jgi:hypothetical protein
MKKLASALAAIALCAAFVLAASAEATPAPGATTGTASATTASSATVTGTVNPNGTTTSYYFEHGTTSAYGQQTTTTSAGSGTGAVAVQATLSGLGSNTTYHFRLVATSSAGTTDGADATFTASKLPPTVGTVSASQVGATVATLAATVNPNGKATTYAFQYGTTTGYGTQTATASAGSGTIATSVSAKVSGLVSGTTYHFRVVATNADGESDGSDATFATAKLPPGVSAGYASFVNSSSANLSATVNPNGKATTFVVQYGPTTAYGAQTSTGSAGAGTRSTGVHATLTGLSAATVYHYRLVATNADGTSVSSGASFETTGEGTNPASPLPAVSQAAAVNISPHGAQLNGAVNPPGPTTTWYFELGLTGSYGLQTRPQTISGLGPRAVAAVVNGLQSGALYHFRLVAYSDNGLYVGPDYTFTTKAGVRLYPRGVVVTPQAYLTLHALIVRVSGQLRLPPTISSSLGCDGVIALVVVRNGAPIQLRHTSLHADCTYSTRLQIPLSRVRGTRRLSVVGYFWGNAVLKPAQSHAFVTF